MLLSPATRRQHPTVFVAAPAPLAPRLARPALDGKRDRLLGASAHGSHDTETCCGGRAARSPGYRLFLPVAEIRSWIWPAFSGNDTLLLELPDLLPRIAQRIGENQLGVLSQLGTEAVHGAGGLAKAHRKPANLDVTLHLFTVRLQ